jgi:hypothetical protein
VRAKSIRLREPSARVEFCTTPVLTSHSVYSGKDESPAQRWDNGRVQTAILGRAKEALSVASWPDPSVAGVRQPRGPRGALLSPPSLLPHYVPFAVVLHVHTLPDFVTGSI